MPNQLGTTNQIGYSYLSSYMLIIWHGKVEILTNFNITAQIVATSHFVLLKTDAIIVSYIDRKDKY